uniref:Uncharacterized protein n=1 Tax=Candidatus Kentrum sp. LFY TaxID=2126342 RepID=A0A450WXJ4_9GAMM|nr:MAG: hypothetical protein BECKLFY1418C_GA0070996_11024 [Candidatus Kentron sp. LFY]
MANIDLFDEYTAKILGMLYESFPIRLHLFATVISGDEKNDQHGNIVDKDEKPSHAFKVCMATIEWLRDAGYMNCGKRCSFGYKDCVLTVKGLEVLKSVPDSVQTRKTIGDKLVSLLHKDIPMEAAKEAAKAAISAGIGIMT